MITTEKIEHRYAEVLVPRAVDKSFTYRVPEEIKVIPGSIVQVPFGRENMCGVVTATANKSDTPPEKIKSIAAISDKATISTSMQQFIDWVADYTLSPRGNILAMALPVKEALFPLEKKPRKTKTRVENILPPAVPPTLSGPQKNAAQDLRKKVAAEEYSTTLLGGVTGSGKTEVYLEAVSAALESDKQALVMLPEIVLTAQMIRRFTERFGLVPTEWHSNLTPKTRRENYQKILSGESQLIVGARSALFLPYAKLGVIIVDEEHENAYKQEDGVVYHARDMAVARGYIEKFPVILVSATPSLETLHNVAEGKFSALHLPERHGGARLPDIHIVDMRQEHLDAQHWVSAPLKIQMAETLSRGEQVLLYLNRRGYAPLTLCRSCGHRMRCPNCTAWLVEHRKAKKLQCHHCDYHAHMPKHCPSCQKEGTLAACGPGVERLEEEVRECFPEARIVVMTSDSLENPKEARRVVEQILAREVDVIIGTQMVTKGHHFPHLTLVGVVDADIGLEGGDLRAAEKSYQLLHQVSGRAGREGLAGQALVQTYAPESNVMTALMKNDRDGFSAAEQTYRKTAGMPPYGALAALVISGKDEAAVRAFAADLVRHAPKVDGIRILGPAPAPIALLRGKYRYRILLKSKQKSGLQRFLRGWLANKPTPSTLRLKVDIDPYNFM